jgi:hypothetical protein
MQVGHWETKDVEKDGHNHRYVLTGPAVGLCWLVAFAVLLISEKIQFLTSTEHS